jgi:renalase
MRVIVVGAGLSGLAAARSLHEAGHEVTVFDKGRSPGGRLATRRMGEATLDHGAQFFTVRGEALATQVTDWVQRGLVGEWCRGFEPAADGALGDGHPRYVATSGMTSLAKDLARGLDVRCSQLVFAIRREWEVVIDDGAVHPADAVVVTCPLPQTFSLLFEAGVELPFELFGDDYDRTIALLAVLDGPSGVPAPGGVTATALQGTPFSFIGDNLAKGVSAIPAVTFHGAPAWSEAHWDDPPDEVHELLRAAASPWLGEASIIESQVKRWRFATPRTLWPEPCWVSPDRTLVIAGDAFAGPKFEGAFESGRAAAAALA